jgi:uncharacterized protein (TIGR00661 family)
MRKRILVTALNWGLGHASRSVPVIRLLQAAGANIVLASDGRALELWNSEFPDLPRHELPGYHVQYPSQHLTYHLARQLPRIAKAIYQERRATSRLLAKYHFDAIISDHRYGCYHPSVPSILICHQMQILAPDKISEWAINQVHRRFLRNFQAHWVPDTPEPPGLAGKLAHQYQTRQTQFIGPLSRLKKESSSLQQDYLVLLSGPEPQRTRLEQAILDQARTIAGKWVIIGGKTETIDQPQLSSNIIYRPFAGSAEINALINSSRYVICRSGYSSIMDLKRVGKPALLIPTPGQTEQEYLADRLQNDPQFSIARQAGLDLQKEIIRLQQLQTDDSYAPGGTLLEKAVNQLLASSS